MSIRPDLAASFTAAQGVSDSFGGTALLVWHDGYLVHEQYGDGVDETSPLQAFSLAKTVLGLVYGLAIEQGVVTLNDPVSRHIEEWRRDPRGDITLLQLLQMRSGLKLYSLDRQEPEALHLIFGDQISEAALATPLKAQPGEIFEYANINAFVAGLALDRALRRSGAGSYVEFLERTLWKPLGQGGATLDIDGPGGIPRFFAGLNATARDWLGLGLLFVEEGTVDGRRIAPAAWIKAMTTPSSNPAYGLLTWLGQPWTASRSYGPGTPTKSLCREPYLADDMIFFDGLGGQRVYVSAHRRLVIVRTGAPSKGWEDSALPNAVIRELS